MKRVLAVCIFFAACAVQAETISESMEYSIARGGKLYDKWFKTNSATPPKAVNPAYPDSGKYKGKKASDWRCKECHGWDYLGKDGAYSSGKHFTGISGVLNVKNMDRAKLKLVLQDKNHGYSNEMLSEKDYMDISNFLQSGMVDMKQYINKENEALGDIKAGKSYYQTVCAGCHGLNGKEEDDMPPLGKLSNKNPWETLHKIRHGQPDAEMPALVAFDIQVSVDILAYIQTLPKE
jgi:thiosulfate dehydrogenase